MDDFSASGAPKAYTRHVLRAIAFLQKGESIFINANDIVQQVMLQMRRKKKLDVVKGHVLKSLSSLTHLGILSRSPSAEYNFYRFPVERALIPARIRCTKRSRFIPQRTRRAFKHSWKTHVGRTAKKMTLPRPRRECPFKDKYKSKRSYAYGLRNRVVCTCCRSHVIPYVETFSKIKSGYLEAMTDDDSNDANMSTVAAEQNDVLMNEIEDPHIVDQLPIAQTPEDSIVLKRYSFDSPIPIVVESTK
ncbi:uncharacterized protein Dvir_GJ26051 [Drosophila virilis]|uniref:Uncharacterized protein n=1 Tax=Drosophila virilis TaxID=7244 RepID=A0A0Q9WV01_DROVI|nr:uncharacterized protein LOC26530821 [Drosophila virilis]KRF85055.1 uncharacterized protein Dvir_GJ26051 [Drosophila virilis]